MDDQNPLRRRSPLQTLMMLSVLAGGVGFGGTGRPDFRPSPAMPPRPLERAPAPPPEPPPRQHQPVFTAKQKLTRAKRKAQRKARKR